MSTVVSILLGVGLGSLLIAPGGAMPHLLAAPAVNTTLLISVLYGIAAVFAAAIPHSTARCCAECTTVAITARI